MKTEIEECSANSIKSTKISRK